MQEFERAHNMLVAGAQLDEICFNYRRQPTNKLHVYSEEEKAIRQAAKKAREATPGLSHPERREDFQRLLSPKRPRSPKGQRKAVQDQSDGRIQIVQAPSKPASPPPDKKASPKNNSNYSHHKQRREKISRGSGGEEMRGPKNKRSRNFGTLASGNELSTSADTTN